MRSDVVAWLSRRSKSPEFVQFLAEGLLRLCSIDTTPVPSVSEMANREAAAFTVLQEMIPLREPGGTYALFHAMDTRIDSSPFYTAPYYTTDPDPYRGRSNLVVRKTGRAPTSTNGIAFNAHIDTVAPFLRPTMERDTVFGRGSADDKGGCVTIVGVLSLLKEIAENFDIHAAGDIMAMFVIDEETGGNGSLSLACDEQLRREYETIVVVETADGQIYPANRGALWYRVEFPPAETAGNSGDEVGLALEVVRSLESTGRAIWEESIHPLFPDRPVQTCHGVLGPYGEHPSRVCGHVVLRLSTSLSLPSLKVALEAGLATYLARYGDKTKEIDVNTDQPKVDHHYDLNPAVEDGSANQFTLNVWGCSGHMGAVRELDGAITKAAFMVESAEEADRDLRVGLYPPNAPHTRTSAPPAPLVLEGGQGFLPTHTIQKIEARLARAVEDAWNRRLRRGHQDERPVFSCNKLHNDSFERSPDSPAIADAVRAARSLGLPVREPLRGFPVSCDARIFARTYPDLEVVTTGPGRLTDAHSDSERIAVTDIAAMSAALALFVLEHGGYTVK
ncbi:MAG TPA: M20/M25/M40 family metallo-hydrolase [Spirochaetia bacterium]|nr:M20/M25/M40 family metallo-hydrolase [Spirochaetia bacterium]